MDQILLDVGQVHDLALVVLFIGRCKAERVLEGSITARLEASAIVTVVCGSVAPRRIIVGATVERDCAVLNVLDVFAPERVFGLVQTILVRSAAKLEALTCAHELSHRDQN